MDGAAERIEQELKARFPESAVQRVEILRHGEDPAVEPGRIGVRVVVDPARVSGAAEQGLEPFHHAHKAEIKQLHRDLPTLLPDATRLEFTDGRNSLFLAAAERPGNLTPVMARLGAVDLETLDTLISAGIAPNRADAVRWALARIRERPAYAQLRERAHEIDALKAQF